MEIFKDILNQCYDNFRKTLPKVTIKCKDKDIETETLWFYRESEGLKGLFNKISTGPMILDESDYLQYDDADKIIQYMLTRNRDLFKVNYKKGYSNISSHISICALKFFEKYIISDLYDNLIIYIIDTKPYNSDTVLIKMLSYFNKYYLDKNNNILYKTLICQARIRCTSNDFRKKINLNTIVDNEIYMEIAHDILSIDY